MVSEHFYTKLLHFQYEIRLEVIPNFCVRQGQQQVLVQWFYQLLESSIVVLVVVIVVVVVGVGVWLVTRARTNINQYLFLFFR